MQIQSRLLKNCLSTLVLSKLLLSLQLLAFNNTAHGAAKSAPAVRSAAIETIPSGKSRRTAEPAKVKLLSLRLFPEARNLWGAKASQQYLVLAKYSDGLERDITLQSRFSVSMPKVASVDENGRVVAVSDGTTLLTAGFQGQTAKTEFRVSGCEEKRPFSFARDIGRILTKQGCNDSSCHGGVNGRGGFKLSLNALSPRDDYKWIVEGGTYQVLTTETGTKTPRIDPKEPEKSLLILKPTMTLPHGGGQRFSTESAEYQTILNWVRSGSPYGERGRENIQVTRLEVFPKEAVMDAQGKHQLVVTAHLSNGQQEDVTHEVRYVSNNPEVVKVSSEGQVEAVRTGETGIVISAAGHAISTVFGVIAKPIPHYPEVPSRNLIDEQVFRKLRKFNIIPSELSGASEFLRRVCLDLTGTLPPPVRVREFSASRDPRKREKLIDTLLNTPEYVDYWTFRFADLFRVAAQQNGFRPRWSQAYWEWIRDSIVQNKPYDQIARERIAALGYSGPSRHFLPNGDCRQPESKMAEQVRVFMGRRLDCAQCHNHPFESWTQNQFWEMTAFFGRMNVINGRGEEFGTVIYDDPDGQSVDFGHAESGKVVHPRSKEEAQPRFLDGEILPEDDRVDLRMKLAEWMTSHPYFAETAVNRMWSYFFGRGIVDPVDDFRSTNPPTHPDLLDSLARDFREHGYDLKHLMRTIVTSRTYQLSSQPNDTNREDRINYSHVLPRSLDAEVLFDLISYVTAVPEVFEHSRSGEKPGASPEGMRAINVMMPDIWPSRFLDIYGRPLRDTVPERRVKPNLSEALHMLTGSTFTNRLSREGGRVDQLLETGVSDKKLVEELFLLALARFPTEEEQTELQNELAKRPSRKEAIQDLLWAFISSREFSENY